MKRNFIKCSVRSSLTTLLLSVIVLVCSAGAPRQAWAHASGMNGYSGNPATHSGLICDGCHSAGAAIPTVLLTGPSTLPPSASGVYTLTITGGPAVDGGLDVSTTAGTLQATGSNTQLKSGEITHTAAIPFSSGSLVFTFTLVAPSSSGTVTLYAAGLSANGSGSSGDGTAATTLVVDVAPQTLTAVDTTGNNFTMLDPTGALVGGTNDVHFTWDGTELTSVAASGQVSNATLTSVTPFFGVNWTAHDVAIYGPGTYTVYSGCAAGSPGCGTGTPYTFTVATGQLGAHMLFNWGGNVNIDVVDVWEPKTVFGPSSMWTGAGGSNPASRVWDWMSSDWDGNGINGAAMVDGPFIGFSANFNLMGVPSKIGVFLSSGEWYLDEDGNGAWDGTLTDSYIPNFGFGVVGAKPFVSSEPGTGNRRIGIYASSAPLNAKWFIDLNGNGAWDGPGPDGFYNFGGQSGAVPVIGDWTGTGTKRIGIYANGKWYLDLDGDGAWDGTPTDALYNFGGQPGAIPVTGDWTGTGITKIGIYLNGTWYLDLDGNGAWDGTATDGYYGFGGQPGAIPVTGDWTGGTTKIGIYLNGKWYLDLDGNGAWDGVPTDGIYVFGGQPSAIPVTGKW